MIKHFSLRFTLFLVLLDALLVICALLVATGLRIVIPFGLPGTPLQRLLPLPIYFAALMLYNIIFVLLNVYNPRNATGVLRELQAVLSASVLAWLMLLGALYLSFRDVSRLQTIYFLGVHLLLVIASRLTLRSVYHARGSRRFTTRNVLIVGTNGSASQMLDLIRQHMWTGLCPVGMVALEDSETPESPHSVGTLRDIESIVQQLDVSEVVVAVARDTSLDLKQLILRLQALPVNIRLVPQYTDLAFLQVHIEDFSGMPLLTLKEPVLTPYQRLLKRVFDIIITLLILIPALPLMGIIALLIRLDSPGHVIFRQRRVGEGGKPFTMYKFRSMVAGAVWQQEMILRYDEHGRPVHKNPHDPRVTRIGHFLRVTSLDELPQLFNILRGEMSLVGPRPEMPDLVDHYEAWQRKRFEVPQGLTGWWQINGRANKPMHLHTEEDLFYIRNYSIWLDLQILWRTVWVVMSRRGAF